MNHIKVYSAPSAEVMLLVPTEDLAASWIFNQKGWKENGLFQQSQTDPMSGVAINGGFPNWTEDGYTLNNQS